MRLEMDINPRKVGLILAIVSIYFAVQSIIAEYLIENVIDNTAYPSLVLTIDLFSVNAEETIPTWYATLLLFVAAVLLLLIAFAKRTEQDRYRWHWFGLGIVFLYLSMDEGAVIHEIVADEVQNTLHLTGFLTFGWQIVAAPLVILFALLYLRFLFHLPPRTRNLFILAGVVYVGGALVVDGISANQLYVEGGITIDYLAIGTIEELCEMLGIVVFIYCLLAYAVEMQYTYVFRPQVISREIQQSAINAPIATATVHNWQQNLRLFSKNKPLVLGAIVIIGLNVALISWAYTTTPPSRASTEDTVVPAQTIIDEIATGDVLVTRLTGIFGGDNAESREVTKALLQIYDEVMVVTMNSSASSYVLAADKLPFDQNRLSDLLNENGETQFIIFDTLAVKAIVAIP